MKNGLNNYSGENSTPVEETVNLIQIPLEGEMKSAYLDYAMSVIIGRAIPDVRDGLKPVHRRILYAMYEARNFHNQPYKKSARIVGDVIGKYHPHGDAAVYDALVRMAQDFSMREPLVDGQGNFGSLDGDPPAAMRYTEVRLAPISQMLLESLEEETVDWMPNYDESLREPKVLPAKFPNLLVNGARGIAVGMATNIPPHNLGEIIEGVIALIENPELTIDQLMNYIPGPDFPTGGVIVGKGGIRSAYQTGQGSIVVRATCQIEEEKGKSRIVFTSIPYQTNKSKILERTAQLVKDKRLPLVANVRDESNREGIRIVIELKKEANPQIVLNQLYKHIPLQDSFDVKNLSIVKGQPRILNLKEALNEFINFRVEVVTRRSQFQLKKAEQRLHLLEGLAVAVDNIDETVAIIKSSKSTREAEERLMKRFSLSLAQVKAILDMRLARLTALERKKIDEEMKSLSVTIAKLMEILSKKTKLMDVIVRELKEVRDKYAGERKTEILEYVEEIKEEDLIPEEEMVIAVSHLGYIKRTPISVFRSQGRGGRGVTGMETRQEDFIKDIYITSSHATMLFFSDRGKVYSKRVYEIPQASRTSRGKGIANFVGMGPGENVAAVLPITHMEEGHYIVTVTERGFVKKSDIMFYSNIRSSGIIGVVIEEGDKLVEACVTDGNKDILLCTKNGMSIRFSEEEVRPTGRNSRGVIGTRLKDESDVVVGMSILPKHEEVEAGAKWKGDQLEEAEEEEAEETEEIRQPEELTLLLVCSLGYGKRTNISEYKCQGRGGKGIIAIKTTEKNGHVVGSVVVRQTDEIMIVTDKGKFIRIPASSISVYGRNTQGVKLIKLEEGERVSSIDRLRETEIIDRKVEQETGKTEMEVELKQQERPHQGENSTPSTRNAGGKRQEKEKDDDLTSQWAELLSDTKTEESN